LNRNSTKPAVVNTSSVYGPSGAVGYAAYGASKSGVLGLTRTAALEWADAGIRVNALLPGGVLTASWRPFLHHISKSQPAARRVIG